MSFIGKSMIQLSVLTFLYILGAEGITAAMTATAIYIVPFSMLVAAFLHAAGLLFPPVLQGLQRISVAFFEFIATFGDYDDDDEDEDDEDEDEDEEKEEDNVR